MSVVLCECGCGMPAPIATRNFRAQGVLKGQPFRFVAGHSRRGTGKQFDEKYAIDSTSGCWVWTGAISPQGYGVTHDQERKVIGAHRASYERVHGPIPQGLHLDHLCRNRACVNPDHLEPVTQAENSRRGLNTKLTARAVAQIKSMPALTPARLGAMFGVSGATISNIRAGRVWADVAAEDYGFSVPEYRPARCIGVKAGHDAPGSRCTLDAIAGSQFCRYHESQERAA